MRFDRPVAAWSAAGLLVCAVYPLLEDGKPVATVVYSALGAATVVAILAGVRRNRPAQRGGWFLFAAAALFQLIGDILYEVYRQVLDEPPFPSLADAFYLAACPMLVAGMLMLTRGRLGRDRAGLLDAAIIATGLGLVWWVAVIGPLAADTSVPLLERLVGAAYPACDLVLLAVVARLLTRPGRMTRSLALMTAGTAALMLADAAFQVVAAYAPDLEGLITVGWLAANTLWGAAALHPSAAGTAPAAGTVRPRLGHGRLAVLGACTLVVPTLLFAQGVALGPAGVSWLSIGVGAVLLFLLVLARMAGFVGEVQRQSRQLERLAMRDELTGLPNRRVFEQRLTEAVAAGSAHVAMLDLNGFKEVNDRFGHAVGDELLTVTAQRLAAQLRDGDVAARMGGDEFAVLVPGATAAEMDAVVERIGAALRAPVPAMGHELMVGASIGTADTSGAADGSEVLRRADIAMYAAKQAGGNRHRRYGAELDARAGERARLGAELRTGLDDGRLRVVYQPIVELSSGRTVAAEALVRWDHPERGILRPTEFLAVAEESGLAVELGSWVLRTACAQAAAWRDELGAAAPRMGVNVSARQLAEPGFADLVTSVLAGTGLEARRLIVEVSEDAVLGSEQAARTVRELRDRGVRAALDNFGTGRSSLGLLQDVPVDILKVDRSFAAGITAAGRDAVIATTLIRLGAGLGLTTVAEGVGTAEQAAELQRIGCRFAQGQYFGGPVAGPDLARARAIPVS